jgi:trimethylamine--corrinoid protein Co-methyltransferase
VGPGGDYISTDHTYRHFREEQWQPKLLNRDDPDTWEMKGSRTYGEILEEKAREILETHEPEPLPEEVQARLDEIAERAESALEEMAFEA